MKRFSFAGKTALRNPRQKFLRQRCFLVLVGVIATAMVPSVRAADTQAPTAPSNLATTSVSDTQISLSWTGSTDNVGVTAYLLERCKGAGCTNFAQIASIPSTAYNDTTLTVSTSYSYRVRARDAANNKSAYSSVVTVTTLADTQPPTAPTGLVIAIISDTQLNLSWTAATDDVKVTGYLVERCLAAGCSSFAQVATPTAVTYNNTGLVPASSYSYRVRAKDAANNLSLYSNIASAATLADSQAPTVPAGLTLTVASSTKITVTWTASTDDVKVTGYHVERCQGVGCTAFTQVATPTGTSYSNTGLVAGSSYSYRVRANDAAGNLSAYSSVATAATTGTDVTAPSAPTSLAATPTSSTQINLSWIASTDNVSVTGYRVERCQGVSCTTFAQIATSTSTTYSDTTLNASTSYSYRVRATDAANNLSAYSNTASATTQILADTQPPTAPSSVSATPLSPSHISITWTSSTDNVGVTAYLLERCQGAGCTSFAQIASTIGTGYDDTGLVQSTSYSYRVRATDAAGNLGGYSMVTSATTQTPLDTQPPTQPTNLTAIPTSSSQVNLTWTASTDNVGVIGYLVERCHASECSTLDTAATNTAYADTGLTPDTVYTYRVSAYDARFNLSAYSVSATTQTPTAVVTFTYGYDSLGRLIRAAGTDGSEIDYQYDANGNVTTINRF